MPGALDTITAEQSGANVIVVSSGWGGGCYPAFIGYTGARQVGSFVTDFMVLPRERR